MRIIQLLPNLAYGDAIGNDALAIRDLICEMGYETGIYAEKVSDALPQGTADLVEKLPPLLDEDIVIYHGSTGSELNYKLPKLGGRKVMIYHNITPHRFFAPYQKTATDSMINGFQGLVDLGDKIDYCIAVSAFNKTDLLRMGYTCPIDVCPVLIPFSDYSQEPDRTIIERYGNDGYVNIVFVGRVMPNKKHEDVIRAFYVYHKYYNSKSRLIFVGNIGMGNYRDRLIDYAEMLGVGEDIIFTGHIRFDGILAWYRVADVFLCMSEHEGFCVPLLEAMYFDVPVVAYASTAIPDTLGGAGVLLQEKSLRQAAEAIDRLVRDAAYREQILEGQRERLKAFSYEAVKSRLQTLLEGFIESRPSKRQRIVQVVSTLNRGDAVGNDVMAVQNMLLGMGYPSPIYSLAFPVDNKEMVLGFDSIPDLRENDILLYHHATGTIITQKLTSMRCKRLMVYHNITPPAFFEPYDVMAAEACEWGYKDLKLLLNAVSGCIADSQFNKSDLEKMGYTCPIDVCPVLIPFEDYGQEPDAEVLNAYQDGKTNIVFVGRVAPNKRFEDVISAFAEYKKLDKTARLILVGGYDESGKYYQFLKRHVEKLNVKDVIFTGHTSFPAILAYYRSASVFLCMSEHEGFCVPLLEAMYFDVPVVAYASTAVPETLGDSGVLLEAKEPKTVADALWRLVHDGSYRESVVRQQRDRLRYFSHDNVEAMLKKIITAYLE